MDADGARTSEDALESPTEAFHSMLSRIREHRKRKAFVSKSGSAQSPATAGRAKLGTVLNVRKLKFLLTGRSNAAPPDVAGLFV